MSEDSNEVKCPHCSKAFKIDQTGYANILQQVRDVEFKNDLNHALERELKVIMSDHKLTRTQELGGKDNEIGQLKAKLKLVEAEKQLAINEAVKPLNNEIQELGHKINDSEKDMQLAVMRATENLKEEISTLDQKIKSKDDMIRMKDEEIEFRKDMKLKMSVKDIGEKLEKWCENQFNTLRASAFPNAYFEKDNKVVKEDGEKKGSKGDYVFREADSNDTEFVSIMFEMKDKEDDTKGETNDSHLKQLDNDRKKKNCEYAVLVSMLEMDNELYNNGIVDKSHKYEKMYVVRPQNFITILTIIRNESKKAAQIRNELAKYKAQNYDVDNFEKEMEEFQSAFGKNVDTARKYYDTAIKDIDDTIKKLEKIKNSLTTSGRQLRLANDKSQELSIKKLTKNNPTMKEKFDEITDDDDDDEASPVATLPPQ
jgi:hypothetical protein